jgi:CBS domain-containing protein
MTVARDIMSEPVITVTPTTPITEIARVLLDNRISGCPVVDVTGTLRGIISRANLLDYALGVEGGALTPILRFLVPGGIAVDVDEAYTEEAEVSTEAPDAQEIMTQDVVWVTPEAPLAVVAGCMSQERIHRVPVMDGGKVVGIITSLDLLSEFAEREKGAAGA